MIRVPAIKPWQPEFNPSGHMVGRKFQMLQYKSSSNLCMNAMAQNIRTRIQAHINTSTVMSYNYIAVKRHYVQGISEGIVYLGL